jgi:hypothetical protein
VCFYVQNALKLTYEHLLISKNFPRVVSPDPLLGKGREREGRRGKGRGGEGRGGERRGGEAASSRQGDGRFCVHLYWNTNAAGKRCFNTVTFTVCVCK